MITQNKTPEHEKPNHDHPLEGVCFQLTDGKINWQGTIEEVRDDSLLLVLTHGSRHDLYLIPLADVIYQSPNKGNHESFYLYGEQYFIERRDMLSAGAHGREDV